MTFASSVLIACHIISADRVQAAVLVEEVAAATMCVVGAVTCKKMGSIIPYAC